MSALLFLFLMALSSVWCSCVPPTPPETDKCSSQIYCEGKLLDVVQKSGLFPDSKTFVDMAMKTDAKTVLGEFNSLEKQFPKGIPVDQLSNFVNKFFSDPSQELQSWIPEDWKENNKLLNNIADSNLREWAKDLNKLWKELGRNISDDVCKNPDKHSLIWVPNGFIIPGGRFRELYYWDTYWIINGLLKCGMTDTAKGIIENLVYLVKTYGYVPNGSRIYYIGRSQPPLLIQMVDAYYRAKPDPKFLKDVTAVLESEMTFWENHRSETIIKEGIPYKVFKYDVEIALPRPESYKEDTAVADTLKDKNSFYKAVRSAAESGWDFSTRWFVTEGTNKGNLRNLQTSSIIPVDLNAIMHKNYKLLGLFHATLGEKDKANSCLEKAAYLQFAINNVLWNKEQGIWLDYDSANQKSRDFFYLSNFVPLWTGSYNFDGPNRESLIDGVLKYIESNNLGRYLGGIPTSLEFSGEQWDYPNAWPPLQAFIIQGLDRLNNQNATNLAFSFAQKWIYSNYKGYKDFNQMFEKYSAINIGEIGGGGEYTVQKGFGWTNGFDFELLDRWGASLTSNPS